MKHVTHIGGFATTDSFNGQEHPKSALIITKPAELETLLRAAAAAIQVHAPKEFWPALASYQAYLALRRQVLPVPRSEANRTLFSFHQINVSLKQLKLLDFENTLVELPIQRLVKAQSFVEFDKENWETAFSLAPYSSYNECTD